MDDKELVSLCRKGDCAAQEELYRRYAPALLGVCRRYSQDSQMAEDMLHDGFIKIFRTIDKYSYRGNGSLMGWCRRVMVNSAIDRLRNEKKLDLRFTDAIPETTDPPEEKVRRIPPEVLNGFIAELPPGYRTIFNLYVFDGMSHREIAGMLGIRENSSSSQFVRAKKTLAARINKWLEDAGE